MNLPFLKKSSKNTAATREYLLALQINHGLVKSAIWSVINNQPQVLSVGSSIPWDDTSEENLIEACDQSLSDAENRFDPTGKLQPGKVIFGLPSDWMEGEKIQSDRLHLLRNLTQKLSLTAVGFVVTPEAIVRFLQHTEGVPPTTILLGFLEAQIEVTLVRLGKIDAVHLVKRSSDVASDVVEGLSRYAHVDMLPSRILLYDSGLDLEDIKQTLLNYPWQSPQTKLPFLHFPKIETLPVDYSIRAIALAGGSEVAQAIGLVAPEVTVPQEDLGFSATDLAVESEPAEAVETETYIPITQPSVHRKFTLPKIKLPFIVPIVGILVLVIGLFAAYWNLPKAKVDLSISPRNLQSQFDLTADQFIETTVSADKSTPATGTKLVGDKAVGQVTVYNNTDAVRSFPSGTIITSPSGLKFTFDSAIQIASASGTAILPVSGKATVKVTAAQVGSDSNLSAGTIFKVGSFSSLDYSSTNETAFNGGSSRQVQAISKNDQTKLRTELTVTLKDQAIQKLQEQVSTSQILIPESTQTTIQSEDFNYTIDEAADQLTLKLSVKAKALVLIRSELDQRVANEVKTQVPSGFALSGSPTYSFTVKKVDKTSTSLSAAVSSPILPQLNPDLVAKNISGKTLDTAKEYLSTLPDIKAIDITFQPDFIRLFKVLPHIFTNITVTIKSTP